MPGTCLQLEPATSKCSPSPVWGYSSWTVGSPKTFCPNICLDLWKPCSPRHNHPDSFPRNYRVFLDRSATGSLATHTLLTQLACDWLAGFQPLSPQGMTDKGCPAKKISSFPKQNASLCDSPHPPKDNCWAFPLVPAGSQTPKLSTTTLHDGVPPHFRSTARAWLPAIAGRQAKKFWPKVDTVLKNPDIYWPGMPGTCLQLEPATSKCSPSPVWGYSSWTVGSPKTFCPNICLDLWKPCSPRHNHPDSFPRNYRVFLDRSATGSLATHTLLTQLACDWLAGFQPLSPQGMTDKGCPAKKISSFPKQNASLCDSPHPPKDNCWAFPLVPAGSQTPKLSTTTLHDGVPPHFRSTARAWLPAIAGRQAKKFWPKVDTVLKNPDIYWPGMPGTCLQLEPATSKCSPSPVWGYSSWTVGSPKTFCPNICLDLWKPCSPRHNHPDSFPRNYRVFLDRSATGSLATHTLLTQLACDWLAGFQPLSPQGMTDKGCPAKKISSFPKQNASLCDSPHPPKDNCWAFPLVPAGSQTPKLSTTTLHDGVPPHFRSTARAWLPAIAGRQAKKFWPKVDTVLKNPDIYYF